MGTLRSFVWAFRQWSRSGKAFTRPVLDLVDFGTQPGIVLDVGANCGGFASNILVRAPLMQVHCFEPNEELGNALSRKAQSWGKCFGHPRCLVSIAGVGSANGDLDLIVTGMHGASSFLPVSDVSRNGWPSTDFSEVRRIRVPVIRIDDYLHQQGISKVQLLKIDVQGFELEVLKGCGDRLYDIRFIIAEVQFQPLYDGAPPWYELISYVAKFGFEPLLIDGFCFDPDGKPLQGDVLLRRRD